MQGTYTPRAHEARTHVLYCGMGTWKVSYAVSRWEGQGPLTTRCFWLLAGTLMYFEYFRTLNWRPVHPAATQKRAGAELLHVQAVRYRSSSPAQPCPDQPSIQYAHGGGSNVSSSMTVHGSLEHVIQGLDGGGQRVSPSKEVKQMSDKRRRSARRRAICSRAGQEVCDDESCLNLIRDGTFSLHSAG